MTPIEMTSIAVSADVPVILWGPPGTGKTAHIRELANRRGAHLETLIGSTMDPVDVGGMPVVTGGEVNISAPAWARRIRKILDLQKPAWLFFDEMSCAPPSVQAALLRVIHERQVGDVDLTGCKIIAASNNADTAADGGVMSPATSNRWCHVEWVVDPGDWITGELSGWGKPRNQIQASVASSVCSFIRRSPKALLCSTENAEKMSGAWNSPRSWSNAISLVSSFCSEGGKIESSTSLFSASVGVAAAIEWHTYHISLSLPDPEDILSGKKNIPTRGDEAHAALTALVAAVLSTHDDRTKRICAAWGIIGSVRPDIAINPAKALLSAAPEIAHPEAIKLGEKILGVKK